MPNNKEWKYTGLRVNLYKNGKQISFFDLKISGNIYAWFQNDIAIALNPDKPTFTSVESAKQLIRDITKNSGLGLKFVENVVNPVTGVDLPDTKVKPKVAKRDPKTGRFMKADGGESKFATKPTTAAVGAATAANTATGTKTSAKPKATSKARNKAESGDTVTALAERPQTYGYTPPNWRYPKSKAETAKEIGASVREVLDNALNLEYSPPDWTKQIVKSEINEIRGYLKRRERTERIAIYNSLFSRYAFGLLFMVLAIAGVNVYKAMAVTWGLPLGSYANVTATGAKVGVTDAIYSTPITEGMNIAGYEVTSGFGQRDAPETANGSGSSDHKGVDFATPEGTNVYGLGNKGTVECEEDPDGYGTYAIMKTEGIEYDFLLGHLSKCVPGQYKPGLAIGQTGNTGNSSGAHLHFEQHTKDGTPVQPTEGYAWWLFQGNPVKPIGGELAKEGWGGLDGFVDAFIAQESGGQVDVVNSIGASGLYQFLPSTLDMIDDECFGRSMTQTGASGQLEVTQEFLQDKNIQNQAAKCFWAPEWKLIQQETSDPTTQCRMLASFHYSGDRSLFDSTSAQTDAPSIADYTQSVCGMVANGVK